MALGHEAVDHAGDIGSVAVKKASESAHDDVIASVETVENHGLLQGEPVFGGKPLNTRLELTRNPHKLHADFGFFTIHITIILDHVNS